MHIHERCYITRSSKLSLQQFWKRKEKENAEETPAMSEKQDLISRKKNVNHHHLTVCDLQLVDVYIIKIDAFGVWKVLTKIILLEKLENWCEYQLFQDGGNLKDARSTSRMNCCVSDYLSLLKLYLLFPIKRLIKLFS